MKRSVYIGWDQREASAFAVARHSLLRHVSEHLEINGLVLSALQTSGLYTRKVEMRASAVDRPIMWDPISGAPMSTQHAIARFLVKELAHEGWAMFCDGDVLFRGDVVELFNQLDPRYAIYCVKHTHIPPLDQHKKMDGQPQLRYPRKNWSSVYVLNCDHPANRHLTVELINCVPGRDLHRFCWLGDDDIGELDQEWNWLVGYSTETINPKLVHFTSGIPDMPGYENVPYADEWRRELAMWAEGAWVSVTNSWVPEWRAVRRFAEREWLSETESASTGIKTAL